MVANKVERNLKKRKEGLEKIIAAERNLDECSDEEQEVELPTGTDKEIIDKELSSITEKELLEKDITKLSDKELFDKIKEENLHNIVICPVQGQKEMPPYDFEEINPILEYLKKDQLPSNNMQFPKGTVCSDGRLDLCKQSLGVAGCMITSQALKENKAIKALLLGTNGIGNKGAEEVAELIKENTSIKTVYLGCNYIAEQGSSKLAKALWDNKNVKGLWLKRNPVGIEGSKFLGEMILHNNTLTTLDLFGTTIGDQGVKIICDNLIAAKDTSSIERVFFGGNSLTAESGKITAELITKYKKLKDLFLNVNFIGDEGVKHIAEAMKDNDTIVQLGLASNGLTEVSLKPLLVSLASHPTLSRLDLGRSISTKVYNVVPNNFDNKTCFEIVCEYLKENPKITWLNFTKCNFFKFNNQKLLVEAMKTNTHLCEFVGFKMNKDVLEVLSENRKNSGIYSSVPEDIADIISVYRTAKKIY